MEVGRPTLRVDLELEAVNHGLTRTVRVRRDVVKYACALPGGEVYKQSPDFRAQRRVGGVKEGKAREAALVRAFAWRHTVDLLREGEVLVTQDRAIVNAAGALDFKHTAQKARGRARITFRGDFPLKALAHILLPIDDDTLRR
jgi:hypothetical protein